jgi:hypothetical protein
MASTSHIFHAPDAALAVAQNLAKRGNMHPKRGRFDNDNRPDPGDQLIRADEFATLRHVVNDRTHRRPDIDGYLALRHQQSLRIARRTRDFCD